MRQSLFIVLLFAIGLNSNCQIIKGIVLDKQTRDTISFASVYFNGTSTGTYTDKKGEFELDVTKYTSMPLIVSAIGYYSSTITNHTSLKQLIVYLQPKVYEIGEIVIKEKSLANRKRYNMSIFKREFLGRSDNAVMCKIINEEDISFNYGSDRDTLKAFAAKPLIIENEFLGYRITYFLDKFEYYKRDFSFAFSGNIIFSILPSEDEDQIRTINRRRQNTYMGSRMHFFRELWLNDLKSTGFTISNAYGDPLTYEDVVLEKQDHEKYLSYKGSIRINYYDRNESFIVFIKQPVLFENNGYYDASGIIWEGSMASQRIGDMLPYDYNTMK
jgi:hypothetical protein